MNRHCKDIRIYQYFIIYKYSLTTVQVAEYTKLIS